MGSVLGMGRFFKKNWSTILLFLVLLIGLCLLLYPSVSDWWNTMHQSRAIASYEETVGNLTDEETEAIRKAAQEYNAEIMAHGVNFFMTEEERAEYEGLLNFSGDGIMGYIQIPSIGVNLPIYHGTGETVLQVAAGHLEGTSLPVGGESTHTVLSGHRGLPSAKLFTDLDQLVEGDIFTLNVLGETLTYMVDQIRIVLPEETEELMIRPGLDLCTLVTCTPYGVNTHRILVRGTRIDNLKEAVVITSEATRIPSYLVIPAVGVPLLFILLVLMLIYYSFKPVKKSSTQLAEEYRREIRSGGNHRGENRQ